MPPGSTNGTAGNTISQVSSPGPLTSTDHLASAYLDAAADAIIATDELGIIVMANRQAEALFGYDRSELLGQEIELLVPSKYGVGHRAHRTRYRAKPEARQMGDEASRVHGRRKDGSLVPVEVALSPVEFEGERGVIAIVRDLTERMARESRHELVRRSLDAIEDAVFIFNPDTLNYSYVNAGAEAQVGYERAELTNGMTPLHIMPSHTEAAFRSHIAELMLGQSSSISITTEHRRRDGIDVPVEILLQRPSLDLTDEPTVVAIVRDITERRKSEELLRQSERAFRTAFNDAPVAMAITRVGGSRSGQIVESNQALSDLLGWPRLDLQDTRLSDLVHPEDVRDILAGKPIGSNNTNSTDVSPPATGERRYRHQDGHYIWGDLHSAELRAIENSTHSLSHIVDVSRRVDAELERDRREKLLSALAEIRRATLQETSIDDVLAMILTAAKSLLSAPHAFIAIPTTEGGMVYRAMSSTLVADQSGNLMATSSLIKNVLLSGEPILLDPDPGSSGSVLGLDASSVGASIIVPLLASASIEGVLVLAREPGDDTFVAEELDVASSLGAETAVSMELGRARADRRRIFLVEDRERIARDLHDVVIQRIFAAGMSLNASLSTPHKLADRAADVVDELDATIDVIRETIFKLTEPDYSLAGEIGRVIDRYRTMGRNDVFFELQGDLDLVPATVGDHLVPTINELLSNVERHANASSASAQIKVGASLVLTVADDGTGIDHDKPHGFGIRNVTNRAEHLGGSVHLRPGPDDVGTIVTWTVPLRQPGKI